MVSDFRETESLWALVPFVVAPDRLTNCCSTRRTAVLCDQQHFASEEWCALAHTFLSRSFSGTILMVQMDSLVLMW